MKIYRQPQCHWVAKRLMPTIYCGFEHWVDVPAKFGATKFDPKPTVYYRAMRDEENDYLLCALYSPEDYTKCIFADILGLGEHRHDLEGFLVGEEGVITVAHHELIYSRRFHAISRESRGHAIYPAMRYLRNPIFITHPRLVCFDDLSSRFLNHWDNEFQKHGVNMPWRWSHRGKYKGMMWSHPRVLFEVMKK